MLVVRELIEQLRKLPQDAVVVVDGCDCEEYAKSAELRDVVELRGPARVRVKVGEEVHITRRDR